MRARARSICASFSRSLLTTVSSWSRSKLVAPMSAWSCPAPSPASRISPASSSSWAVRVRTTRARSSCRSARTSSTSALVQGFSPGRMGKVDGETDFFLGAFAVDFPADFVAAVLVVAVGAVVFVAAFFAGRDVGADAAFFEADAPLAATSAAGCFFPAGGAFFPGAFVTTFLAGAWAAGLFAAGAAFVAAVVAFFTGAVFFGGTFFAAGAAFVAGALFAGAFFAAEVAFFAGAFFAGAFFAGAFFAGAAFFAAAFFAGAAFVAGAFFAGACFTAAFFAAGTVFFTGAAFFAGAFSAALAVPLAAAAGDLRLTTLRAAEAALPARDRVVLRAMRSLPGTARERVRGVDGDRGVQAPSMGEGISAGVLSQRRHALRDGTVLAGRRPPHPWGRATARTAGSPRGGAGRSVCVCWA